MRPGPGGGGMFERIFAGLVATALTSIFMAGFIAIILFAPKPYPRLQPVIKPDPKIQDGLHQTKYWVGLLKEEWNYENGLPHGHSYQFYPNGSVLRQLYYDDGRLSGEIREYYEKPGRARGVSRRIVPKKPPQVKIGAGQLKFLWNYREGKRHGPYQKYYPNGVLKEEGTYNNERLHGVVRRYHKDGQPKSEKMYNQGKRLKDTDAQLILETIS